MEIKRGFEPENVFWTATAAGSEGSEMSVDWLPDDNGRVAELGGRSDTSLMRNI